MRFSRYVSPFFALYSRAAVCALMVMPRSRSSSIESSTCSAISRSARPPHIWMKRSASVDLPWSMCAMIEKFRMWLCGIKKEGDPLEMRHPPRDAILLDSLQHRRVEPPLAEFRAGGIDQHRHALAVARRQRGVAVHVDLVEGNAQGAEQACHLLAQMASRAPVEANLCQS